MKPTLPANTSTPSLISTPTPSIPSTHLATPAPEEEFDVDVDIDIDEGICTDLHALYCFDALVAHFEGREPIPAPFFNANEKYALFVTWNTSSHLRPNRKPALRGCIGNFTPMTLSKGLKDYALVSALDDHRFSPVKASELPNLSCNVSLLTPFTPVPAPTSWTPGKHGIHITFPHPSHSHRTLSATYLPEICPDQGWTRDETVLSAISKAGYKGTVKVGDKVWQSLQTKIYGSVKSGTTWSDYVKFKESRGEKISAVKV